MCAQHASPLPHVLLLCMHQCPTCIAALYAFLLSTHVCSTGTLPPRALPLLPSLRVSLACMPCPACVTAQQIADPLKWSASIKFSSGARCTDLQFDFHEPLSTRLFAFVAESARIRTALQNLPNLVSCMIFLLCVKAKPFRCILHVPSRLSLSAHLSPCLHTSSMQVDSASQPSPLNPYTGTP